MSGLSALAEALRGENVLVDYSVAEATALFDLLLLTVMIDGEVSDAELEELGGQVDHFPLKDGEAFSDSIEEHGIAVREELEEILDDVGALDAFIAGRAAKIDANDKRKEALSIIAKVAYADGVDPSEEDLCHQIGGYFELAQDEVEEALLVGSVSRIDG